MTRKLTENQASFFRRMAEREDEREWGFEILLQKDNFHIYFDALLDYGLFSPEHNLGPQPAEDPNHFYIPYWPALNYLYAVAEKAGDLNDLILSKKIMEVIRSVSLYRNPDGSMRENYHTNHKFAKIFGKLPSEAITEKDLGLINNWIASKYDEGLAVRALDVGILNKLLNSDSQNDWGKACIILKNCTAIHWVKEGKGDVSRNKPVTVCKEYWLIKLINRHSTKFGIVAGLYASKIFLNRIKEIFSNELSDYPTFLKRPAVEDHSQNHNWEKTINCMVDGLRDVLLSWVEHKPKDAIEFVREIIEDDNEMAQRVGIYVLNEHWPLLDALYDKKIIEIILESGKNHESYHLLLRRFSEFNKLQKQLTIEAIKAIEVSDGEDPEHASKYLKRKWLSAIKNNGCQEADDMFHELDSDSTIGPLSEHPDFLSYFTIGWSDPEPSPISMQDLVYFAQKDKLIKKLNEFLPSDSRSGNSIGSLVRALEESVQHNPQIFINKIQAFIEAKRPYQYGLINGFKQLWNKSKEGSQKINWNIVWERLIEFFKQLVMDDKFWNEEVTQHADLTPTRDWIPSIIADFLHDGTRSDEHAYDSGFLKDTLPIIRILLEKSEGSGSIESDTMTQAINTPKGSAIQALFNHTLRACRVSDRSKGTHDDVWQEIKLIFDYELGKCKNNNFEFSTLTAAYIANIHYIDSAWLEINFKKIFVKDYEKNFLCAIDGLSYAPNSRTIYELLVQYDVIHYALQLKDLNKSAKTKIVERILIAYLMGEEPLEGNNLSLFFREDGINYLGDAADLLYDLRDREINDQHIDKILIFWERCLKWLRYLDHPPEDVLSKLSQFICYINVITPKYLELLCAVAGYVGIGHNAELFFEHLYRLVDQYPREVSLILAKVLDVYQPYYDYEQYLLNTLIKLREQGYTSDILGYADRLMNVPGVDDFIKEIYLQTKSK